MKQIIVSRLVAAVAGVVLQAGLWAAEGGAGAAGTAGVPAAPDAAAKEITFRFHDAEIADLIGFLAKLDNHIPILDEKVKGKVSVAAPGKVSLDEAYRIVMAVLDVRGFTLVRTEQFLRVVAKQESTYAPLEVFYGIDPNALPVEDRMVTALIPIAQAKAAQVLETLRPLISPVGNGQTNTGTNLLMVTDVAANIRRLLKIVPYLDQPEKGAEKKGVAETLTEVYSIKYLAAKEIAETLSKVFTGSGEEGKDKSVAVKFTPVETVNMLLVTADAESHKQVTATLAKLDVRRKQVLIEARVVDLNKNADLNMGVTLSGKEVSGADKELTSTIVFGSGLENSVIRYNLTKALNDGGNLNAALEILESKDLMRVLAAPKILTADNQKAKIVIGTEEPILKSKTDLGSEGSGTGKTVSDYIYKDVGFELEVTPHINIDRDVSIEVSLKTTSILGSVDFGDVKAPRMGKRELSATVAIQDGYTLIMGGLIDVATNKNRQQIPWLGDIPVLGVLFGKRSLADDRREMMIFLTPHVIDSAVEGERLTEQQSQSLNRMKADVDAQMDHTWPQSTNPAPLRSDPAAGAAK